MKKPYFILAVASLICLMVFSCTQEDAFGERATIENDDLLEPKFAPPPDLIIETYFTDIQFKSTLCSDVDLPTTHCDFGDAARNFVATVRIRNIGPGTLPAGSIEVQWNDLNTGDISFTTVSHAGLAPQGSTTASRSYWVGPCDCVQIFNPGNCFIHRYSASVDPVNLIFENNEGNNDSGIFETCDGCGPCGVQPVGVAL